jgi:hypothetical protein
VCVVKMNSNDTYAEVVNIPPPPRPEILRQRSELGDGGRKWHGQIEI